MALTPLRPDTRTGTAELAAVEPLPSSPRVLPPQAQTVPSDFSAYAVSRAAAMAVTPVRPETCTGALTLCPHCHTVPSERRAYPSLSPAAMAVTDVSPTTGTGVAENPPDHPLPRPPVQLWPHARTVPSARSA